MLPEKKTKTNMGIALGLGAQLLARSFARNEETAMIGVIVAVIGTLLFIWGCMNYAEGKGHSKWLGLLGLISCLGLIILVFLPDKNKEAR